MSWKGMIQIESVGEWDCDLLWGKVPGPALSVTTGHTRSGFAIVYLECPISGLCVLVHLVAREKKKPKDYSRTAYRKPAVKTDDG